ncbi:type II toxin-antitoxin system PemK/MazF family toxin [Winslowiella iniecta]|uniref:Growth inhibitor PemK n=1 Tax=Winslowiella iniecta TaxID=1560201 RepID=A0A0L7SX41_9GAMM|nr:type II toxin-antitoxin system PemK/MazF family toxin [Winslowiella iniecta]KOC87683.1 growth inhibitor PemK [Winslowiella iniecta]KOC89855.1 growth inhibitor PemK [Winslowiella iniecta]
MARTPRKGEVWLIDPDPLEGRELRGPHYYIVLTEEALNLALGVAICCPISTGANARGVTVVVDGGSTLKGTVNGVVLCHQVRALDLTERRAKFIILAESHLIDEVVMTLVDIIDPQ